MEQKEAQSEFVLRPYINTAKKQKTLGAWASLQYRILIFLFFIVYAVVATFTGWLDQCLSILDAVIVCSEDGWHPNRSRNVRYPWLEPKLNYIFCVTDVGSTCQSFVSSFLFSIGAFPRARDRTGLPVFRNVTMPEALQLYAELCLCIDVKHGIVG